MSLEIPSLAGDRTVRLAQPSLRPTGVAPLDALLGGGFEPGASWLIDGAPGGGKTLLGIHFLAEGLARDEPGLYITAAEPPAKIMQFLAAHWPALESAVTQKRLAVLDPAPFFTEMRLSHERCGHDRTSLWDEIWRFTQDVVKQSRNQGARRIVIDPVTPLLLAFESAIDLWDSAQTLINALDENLGATTLLTHVTASDGRFGEIGQTLGALTTGVLRLRAAQAGTSTPAIAIEVGKRRRLPIAARRVVCHIDPSGRLVDVEGHDRDRERAA